MGQRGTGNVSLERTLVVKYPCPLLCIDGAAILLLVPSVATPRILETSTDSTCPLPCTLQREKRHTKWSPSVFVLHITLVSVHLLLLSIQTPVLAESTLENNQGWVESDGWR